MNNSKEQEYEKIIEDPNGFKIGITRDGEQELIEYKGQSTKISIPKEIKHIKDEAFKGCESVEEIEIPKDVITIGKYAFAYCRNLKSIWIPSNSNLTSIGSAAFSECRSLCIISLPKGITTIEDGVFCGCESIRRIEYLPNDNIDSRCYIVEIPPTVTQIGDSAFYGCRNLVSVEIPPTVTQIGNNAFCECKELVSVEIPLNVTRIGNSAFSGCKKLDNVKIPPTVTQIGDSAFYGTALKSIKIPKGIDSIKEKTFYNCTELSSVEIPESVTSIGKEAFTGCRNLFSIKLPARIENIGKNALSCLHLTKARCFNINFDFSTSNISLNELYAEFPNGIIRNKDNLPIYFEGNNTATQILKQIFKTTAEDRVKGNILDIYNESSFLKNIEFLQKIIPSSITIDGKEILIDDNQRNNIIASIFTKNPQLLQFNIEETVLNNYQYLVDQKILSEEELHRYYFGYSQEELINSGIVTREETQNKDIEYIIKILKIDFDEDTFTIEIPTLFSTLVVKPTPKNRLELRDRLLLAASILHDDVEARIELLKGNSFETICKNDEIDFFEEIGALSETFFNGYDMFKGIKTSLYRKLNGMNSDLVNDLNELATENQQNIFSSFLNSLETTKCWNLFDSEIERANYFRNEFVGRILYAYLKLVKQIKEEHALEDIDFTKRKDNQQYEKLDPNMLYHGLNIRIEDIIREATKKQNELFDDPELIEVMLQINPYSYDALRNYETKEQNEFCIYAQLAKQYGYLFKKEEKTEISNKIKEVIKPAIHKEIYEREKVGESTEDLKNKLKKIESIFSENKLMLAESFETFIEYVNNQLGLTKVSKKQQEKYLKQMKTILSKFIFDSNEENTIEILRTVDLYCRINNEAQFQIDQGYVYTSEALFDTTRIEEFSHEDRIMYCLFFMNKLAHDNKDINLIASIKDDYRFAGLSERSLLLKKAVDGYSRLEKSGLTIDGVNLVLSKFELNKSNNNILKYLTSTTTSNLNELIDSWYNFSNRVYHIYHALGTEKSEEIPTDKEIEGLINAIRNKLPDLNSNQKEIIKLLLNPTTTELTERLRELEIEEKTINELMTSSLTSEERIKLEELQTKEKNYRVLEAMGIPNLENYKLKPKEIELLNNLNEKNGKEIINKIRRVSNNLLPIAALSANEAKEIKVLAEEYHVFFEMKTALSNNLINMFMKKEEQTLLFALSLDKKGKKEFYKKHGYIIEIQETDNGPTLVCLNKKLTKPFSVHLKNMSLELVEAIEKISASGITPTIAHTNSESSGQYTTLKQGKVNRPNRNDKQKVKITAGFTCEGNREWRDYLVSIFNFAQYEYDEVTFIKEGIEQSEEERSQKLEELFSVICERAKKDSNLAISKIFIESLCQSGYEYTVEDLQKDFKTTDQHLNPQELLMGSDLENNERLESLIELYVQYNPNMVDIVIEEIEGKKQQFISVRGEKSEGNKKTNVEEKIALERFSPEFITKIKERKQSESQTQSETHEVALTTSPIESPVQSEQDKATISSLNINVSSTISAIAESQDGMVMNRGQVQGKQKSNPPNKPPSI